MEKTFLLSSDGLEIPCKLYEPDFGQICRCIIGVHGFGGSKDSEVLVSIAEEMGLFGAATVCFDFPAHGESPMTDRDLSLANCANTLMAVAQWVDETYPDKDICIFATGFGAYVTLHALERLQTMPERVRIVLQTPDVRMADSLLTMTSLTEEAFRAKGRVTLPAERKFEVPFSFYEELKANMIYSDYPMPMLLLHGELDEIVHLRDVENFRRTNEQAKLVVIPGADHRFMKAGEWDMVVDLTRDWFEYEQVLLSDWR